MIENSIDDTEMGYDINLKQTFDREMQRPAPAIKKNNPTPRPKK